MRFQNCEYFIKLEFSLIFFLIPNKLLILGLEKKIMENNLFKYLMIRLTRNCQSNELCNEFDTILKI